MKKCAKDDYLKEVKNRDRFVLSKGHVAPGLYSTLAHRGFFPVEELEKFIQAGL